MDSVVGTPGWNAPNVPPVHPLGAVKLRRPPITGMFEVHSSAPTCPSAETAPARTSARSFVSLGARAIGDETMGAGAPPPFETWPWKVSVRVALLTPSGLKNQTSDRNCAPLNPT